MQVSHLEPASQHFVARVNEGIREMWSFFKPIVSPEVANQLIALCRKITVFLPPSAFSQLKHVLREGAASNSLYYAYGGHMEPHMTNPPGHMGTHMTTIFSNVEQRVDAGS